MPIKSFSRLAISDSTTDATPVIIPRDPGLFGPRNLILTGANTSHHVPHFAGPIAIKSVAFGEVEWRVEDKRHVLGPDRLLLLPDDAPYSMTMDTPTPSRTFCATFRRGLVEDCWRVMNSPHQTLLDRPDAVESPAFAPRLESRTSTLGRALTALEFAVARSADSVQQTILFERLGAAAAEAIRAQRGESLRVPALKSATREEILRRLVSAREIVESDLAAPWPLTQMARSAAMSPYHFHRCFRSVYREAPQQWLSRRRSERAFALLSRSGSSVTEVCLAVGYQSLGSFSASFARRFGVSPSAVRGRSPSWPAFEAINRSHGS